MKKILLFLAAMCCTTSLMATAVGDTIRYEYKGNNLFYKVTAVTPNREVMVVPETSNPPYYSTANKPAGNLFIPDSVEANGEKYAVVGLEIFAFERTNITSIHFPNTMTETGINSCRNCNSLDSIFLSPSIKKISDSSFSNGAVAHRPCYINLDNVEEIGKNSFSGIRTDTIVLPATLKKLGADSRLFYYARGIKLEEGNTAFRMIDGLLYTRDTMTLMVVPGQSTQTYTIADNCKQIYFRTLLDLHCTIIMPQTEMLKISNAADRYVDIRMQEAVSANTTFIVPCGMRSTYTAAQAWQSTSLVMNEDLLYTLSVESEDEAHGSVAQAAPINCNEITINATPRSGYKWYQWSDDNIDNPRTITLTEDMSLIAQFISSDQFGIHAVANDTVFGTVSGGGIFAAGDEATLTASAKEGYIFSQWSDGNTDNPRTITVSTDLNLTAVFEIFTVATVNVVASPAYRGTVSGGGEYPAGSEVTISATPNKGYLFSKWDDDNTDNPRTIVASDTTYTAIFVHKPTAAGDSLQYTYNGNTLYYVALSNTSLQVIPPLAALPYYPAGKKPLGVVNIPATVTDSAGTVLNVIAIGSHAFDRCENITEVVLGENITSLSDYAMANCANLKTVVLSDKVKTLTGQIFAYTKLESINLEHVEHIGAYVFTGDAVKIDTVAIPAGMVSIEHSCIFDGARAITLDAANEHFALVNGILYNADTTMILGLPCQSTDTMEIAAQCRKMISGLQHNSKLSLRMPLEGMVNIYYSQEAAFPMEEADEVKNATGKIFVPCDLKSEYTADNAWSKANSKEMFVYELQYTLTLEAENGSVDKVLKDGECDVFELTATPADGYEFSQWSDGNTDNPREIILDADKTYVAEFQPIETGIQSARSQSVSVKILREGNLLIRRNGQTYTVQGALIND